MAAIIGQSVLSLKLSLYDFAKVTRPSHRPTVRPVLIEGESASRTCPVLVQPESLLRVGAPIWIRLGPSDANDWRQGAVTGVVSAVVTVRLLEQDSPI